MNKLILEPTKSPFQTTELPSINMTCGIGLLKSSRSEPIPMELQSVLYKRGKHRLWSRRILRLTPLHYQYQLSSLQAVYKKNPLDLRLLESIATAVVNGYSVLAYYKTEDYKELPQGLIAIHHIINIKLIDKSIKIYTNERVYHFLAKSKSDAQLWFDTLSSRMEQCNWNWIQHSHEFQKLFRSLVQEKEFINFEFVQSPNFDVKNILVTRRRLSYFASKKTIELSLLGRIPPLTTEKSRRKSVPKAFASSAFNNMRGPDNSISTGLNTTSFNQTPSYSNFIEEAFFEESSSDLNSNLTSRCNLNESKTENKFEEPKILPSSQPMDSKPHSSPILRSNLISLRKSKLLSLHSTLKKYASESHLRKDSSLFSHRVISPPPPLTQPLPPLASLATFTPPANSASLHPFGLSGRAPRLRRISAPLRPDSFQYTIPLSALPR